MEIVQKLSVASDLRKQAILEHLNTFFVQS